MRNLVRFLGIIALVAMMGVLMTACPPEEKAGEEAKGVISIKSLDQNGPYLISGVNVTTGTVLTAVYEGEEESVNFWWFKEEAGLDINTEVNADPVSSKILSSTTDATTKNDDGHITNTYTATTAGSYIVAVAPYDPTVTVHMPKPSKVFAVVSYTANDQNPPDFYGSFKTTAQFKPAGTDVPAATLADETLTITYTEFKLNSTYEPPNTRPKDKDDTHDSGTERIYWKIHSWSKISGLPKGYDYGYKLSVEMYENWGYSPFKTFNILHKTGGGTTIIGRTNSGGSVVRDYEKQL